MKTTTAPGLLAVRGQGERWASLVDWFVGAVEAAVVVETVVSAANLQFG